MGMWKTRDQSLTFLKEQHPSRLDVMEKLFVLLDDIAEAYESSPEQSAYPRVCAVAVLKAKNLASSMYSLILDGLGQEAGALLRPLIEYVEILVYLRLFPSESERALENRLPNAGNRAKAIDSYYPELRSYLNKSASHASFSDEAIMHIFDLREFRLRKRQQFVPGVLLTNVTSLLVQMLVLMMEAMKSLERTAPDKFYELGDRADRIRLRTFDVFGLKKGEPYTGG